MATGASMATSATLPSTAKSFLHSSSPSPLPSRVTLRFHFSQHSSLRCSSSSFISPLFLPSLPAKPRRNQRSSTSIVMSMEAGIGVMGTKLGMMSFFEENGTVVPVTVVGFREGNIVTQVKTEATDGYSAVQVGYRRVRDRKLTKPEMGHLEKSGIIPLRHLQEFKLQSVDGFETNQKLDFEELFKEGDLVDVAGNTIGKGFQGGIKRHHFKRGLMTHGSKSHRQLGSIGAGTTPGRVYKGKKMPGRMGGTKRKIRKLKIVKIDKDLRVVMIKGALPGKPGNLLRITPAKIVGLNIPKN
ncbi:50S ribosomal protein L3, chloroplastic [Impatiens glandulifera]|uniref:50S ribosomal protein L3, chloroplastic n=1 Tax=Impatiens glandulifera TaxID=253017 RepID=UPI001FB0D7DA|nr:50S ribosomal protein L3, chloroplastic [Impatiens glandulifera]